MGSAPSKAEENSGPPAPSKVPVNSRHAGPAKTPVVTESEGVCATVKASMDALKKMKTFGDSAAYDHLNEIIKVYYITSKKQPEELEKACDVIIANRFLDIFVKIWDEFHKDTDEFYSDLEGMKFTNLTRAKVVMWNYSDKCTRLAAACDKNGAVIDRIMREFSIPQLSVPNLTQPRLRHAVKANLGILHNLVRHVNHCKYHIRKNDGVDKILEYEKSTYLIVKAKVVILLAYCINEDENSKIVTGGGVIRFIADLLKSALSSPSHVAETYLFAADEIVAALNKIASNDDNKKVIVDEKVLPLLTQLLDAETCTPDEHLESVNCIWSLAFHPDNKDKIINEPGLLDAVRQLKEKEDIGERLGKAIISLLFVLDLEQAPEPKMQEKGKGKRHIMLSYNWEVQHIMLKLRDFLKSKNIEIWMDVDKMHDSILSAMADAVENSALIVVAMSDAYKNSNSCRTEAEYAYQREVPILPLLLQNGYKADGWLGAMVGTKLYVNLSSQAFEGRFPEVLKQIKILASGQKPESGQLAVRASSSAVVAVNPVGAVMPAARQTTIDGIGAPFATAALRCQAWSVNDVRKWHSGIGVNAVAKTLENCDGVVVAQLCKLLLRSPDTYYKILREELHLNFKDMLLFTNAIEELLS